MIIRNFEYLLALDRERHFSRAAATCSVSQPTLSAGIKQLEEDMGVVIVKRGRRFEGFTAEGERVLAWAQQMMDDCLRLRQELHGMKEQSMQGAFRVGVHPATSAVASILSVAFAKHAPLMQLSDETMPFPTILQKLRSGELDVAFTWMDDAPHDGLTQHLLYRENLLFFTSDQDIMQSRVTWKTITSGPLCLLRSTLPPAVEQHLQDAPNILFTDRMSVLAAQLATGRYASLLPQSLAVDLPASTSLRAYRCESPLAQINVGFMTQRLDPLPAPLHAWMELAHSPSVVEAIRDVLAAHKPFLKVNSTAS